MAALTGGAGVDRVGVLGYQQLRNCQAQTKHKDHQWPAAPAQADAIASIRRRRETAAASTESQWIFTYPGHARLLSEQGEFALAPCAQRQRTSLTPFSRQSSANL